MDGIVTYKGPQRISCWGGLDHVDTALATIFAIDPGPTHSGWCWYEPSTRTIRAFGHDDNQTAEDGIMCIAPERHNFDCVVEGYAPRQQPFGRDLCASAIQVGVFLGLWRARFGVRPAVMLRGDVCKHLTGNPNASKALPLRS